MPPLRRQTTLSPAAIDEPVEAYQTGVPIKELSGRFGVGKETLYQHFERAGVRREPYGKIGPDELTVAR